jgi:hypothetical protein
VRTLKDPKITKYYVSMIPEELPVTEGLELARDIQNELEQEPELVLNRYLECPLSPDQVAKFSGHGFADYLHTLLTRQIELRKTVEGRGLKSRVMPWLFDGNVGEKIRKLSAHWGNV